MRCAWLLTLCSSLLSLSSYSDEGLFSVTPEQMVFASKLSDSNRKIFSHQLSVMERQKALDLWKRMQQEEEGYLPDDAICSMYPSTVQDDDVCFDD